MPTPAYEIDVSRLLEPGFVPPLAGWYAAPLPPLRAEELRAQARQSEQRALAAAADASLPRLAYVVAAHWLGRSVALDYRSLAATLPAERRALLELVYGQLLISCKRVGALEHLRQGFRLAAPALAAADYFALLRRHELLQALVLSAAGSAPMTLAELLTEARIVRQFGAGRGPSPGHHPDDTLG